MEVTNLWLVLFLGLSLGLMHALDSDHLLTLVNFTPNHTGLRNSMVLCSRWAIGHGAAILVIGSAVLIFKMAVPSSVAVVAEHGVGFILMVLGLLALYHAARTLTAGRRVNAHGSTAPAGNPVTNGLQHRIVGIGFLHGTAGSATLLALLPVTQLQPAWWGMSYLLSFSCGVLLAMLLFGTLLGTVFQAVTRQSVQTLSIVRMVMAVPAIGVGVWMVLAAI